MRRIVLVSGTSNLQLSRSISESLKLPLVDAKLRRFANGEIFCEIDQNVRGADVYVMQSLSAPVNDNLMELLVMLDALKRASAESITAVVPHYGYARQDRKSNSRTPISAKLVADLITVAGASRVVTMDLHAGQIQGFFNIPFDNIYASPIFLEYIKANIDFENLLFISPDAGGVERVSWYAKKLNRDIAMVDKRRVAPNEARAFNVVGNVEGKDLIIVDDMIDTAGTLVEAIRALKDQGAKRVFAMATHGIFSGPALERIENCAALEKVIVTDTIAATQDCLASSKVEVLSISPIMTEYINRTFNHDSVSTLFF